MTSSESQLDEFIQIVEKIKMLEMPAASSTTTATSAHENHNNHLNDNMITSSNSMKDDYDNNSEYTNQIFHELQPRSAPECFSFYQDELIPTNWCSNNNNQNQLEKIDNNNETNELNNNDLKEPIASVKVTVGIDEDLRMILDMDPSIVDLGETPIAEEPKVLGLPPTSGGYLKEYKFF